MTGAEPARFRLLRHRDRSGISGTGYIAWGTLYPNGKVCLVWRGHMPTINIYDSITHVQAIHGHHGDTEIVWTDSPPSDWVSNPS